MAPPGPHCGFSLRIRQGSRPLSAYSRSDYAILYTLYRSQVSLCSLTTTSSLHKSLKSLRKFSLLRSLSLSLLISLDRFSLRRTGSSLAFSSSLSIQYSRSRVGGLLGRAEYRQIFVLSVVGGVKCLILLRKFGWGRLQTRSFCAFRKNPLFSRGYARQKIRSRRVYWTPVSTI